MIAALSVVMFDEVIFERIGAVLSMGAVTVTVALAVALLSMSAHESVYVVVVVIGDTWVEPLIALPVEKLVPVHEVAFVELHVRVED